LVFRVKIIPPIKAAEDNIQRRQRRYSEYADPDTRATVVNLEEGPLTLESLGDVIFSEHAVFQEGAKTLPADFDAILIDCVFDPAVDALSEETGLPTFGPTRTTLPVASMVTSNFSIITQTEKQCEMLAGVIRRYGYGDRLVSMRTLGITYEQAKRKEVFAEAMIRQLKYLVEENCAHAVLMGSTTMALSEDVAAVARGLKLFYPGMIALRVMELLWKLGLMTELRDSRSLSV
jgi:allantoin racemase